MLKKVFGFISLFSLTVPVVAFGAITNFDSIYEFILKLFNWATVIIISLAVLYFLWGVFSYITKGGNSESRQEAIAMIISGVVAIFVMISVWGLVGILSSTFDLSKTTPAVPALPTGR